MSYVLMAAYLALGVLLSRLSFSRFLLVMCVVAAIQVATITIVGHRS